MSIIVETSLLKPAATAITVALMEPIDLNQFFRNRPGFWVSDSDSCHKRFDFGVIQSVLTRSYVASLLKANAYDRDIRKELPEAHLSTLEDIAGLIEAQPNGKKGFLLTNGYANIFYVAGKNGKVFSVRVLWNSVDHTWYIYRYPLGLWSAVRQVLCPGTAAL